IPNENTWLEFTDLVFVDPVGTGYSRAANPGDQARFWGVDRDAATLASFIRIFLTQQERTTSPVFLGGESYGGFRVAQLSRKLPEDEGIALSGVILISPALEFAILS